jgi:hypothetical protein
LPKGYFWYKRSDGSLTIIRENDKLPQLVVQKEKGKDVVLTVKASGETLQGFDSRISSPTSSLRASLKNAGVKDPYKLDWKGREIQHLTPDGVAQKSPLMREAFKRGVVKQDDADNLLPMPDKDFQHDNGSITHNGSHPKYDELVTKILSKQEDVLEAKYGSIDKIPDDVLEKSIRDARSSLKQKIDQKSDNNIIRPNKETGKKELASWSQTPNNELLS